MDQLELAKKHVCDGDYSRAIEVLGEDVANFSRAEALRTRGYCHYMMGHFAESIADYSDSLNAKPLGINGAETAHYFRGRIAAEMQNYKLALEDAWSLTKGDPDLIEWACEIVELMTKSMKQNGRTPVDTEALERFLVHLKANVFDDGSHGTTWASELLEWLNWPPA